MVSRGFKSKVKKGGHEEQRLVLRSQALIVARALLFPSIFVYHLRDIGHIEKKKPVYLEESWETFLTNLIGNTIS